MTETARWVTKIDRFKYVITGFDIGHEDMNKAARRVVVRIPMAPPSELSPNKRSALHWSKQREATETLRKMAWAAARDIVVDNMMLLDRPVPWIAPTPVAVHEHIIWPKRRKMIDPDGLATMCKAALDGIVDAGIIEGDSAKHIATVTASQEKGTDPLGWTIITIEEAA